MKKEELNNLKISIRRADIFTLLAFIVLLILYIVGIAKINHIFGFVLAYVAVKFVFSRQYKIYSIKEVSIGINIFVNIAIYGVVMFLAVSISMESLLMAAFVIVIYRSIVLYKFKVLSS